MISCCHGWRRGEFVITYNRPNCLCWGTVGVEADEGVACEHKHLSRKGLDVLTDSEATRRRNREVMFCRADV